MYNESQHQYETDNVELKQRLEFNRLVERYVKGLEFAKLHGRVPADRQPLLNEALEKLEKARMLF